MHRLIIIAAMFPTLCCGSLNIAQRPLDWPDNPSSDSGCSGIAGRYLDRNTVRSNTIVYHSERSWSASGGKSEYGSAWAMFGLYGTAASKDINHSGREFLLEFDSNKFLIVTYKIDGEVVASKEVSPSNYRCEQGLLKFVTYHREGDSVLDKFPNVGSITQDVELFRHNDYLYAKYTHATKATIYSFIPSSHTSVEWPIFPSLPEPDVPTVPPSRSFKWDISKKDSWIEKEFVVKEKRTYHFDIEFHFNGVLTDWHRFMGTGKLQYPEGGMFFTSDPLKPTRVSQQDAGGSDRLSELYKKGLLVKKYSIPGVIVPIRIRIEEIDSGTGNRTDVLDQTVNTEALSHAGGNVYSREISTVELKPGRYKIRAVTIIDVPLPEIRNAETFTTLGIYYDAKIRGKQ